MWRLDLVNFLHKVGSYTDLYFSSHKYIYILELNLLFNLNYDFGMFTDHNEALAAPGWFFFLSFPRIVSSVCREQVGKEKLAFYVAINIS